MVLVDDGVILPQHLSALLADDAKPSSDLQPSSGESLAEAAAFHINRFYEAHHRDLPASGLYQRILEQVERPLLIATLRATGGNQIKAAEVLGLNRNTLRKKIQTLDLGENLRGLRRR
jgi:two-component system nitrogen regulation response regulator GlnG